MSITCVCNVTVERSVFVRVFEILKISIAYLCIYVQYANHLERILENTYLFSVKALEDIYKKSQLQMMAASMW